MSLTSPLETSASREEAIAKTAENKKDAYSKNNPFTVKWSPYKSLYGLKDNKNESRKA